ncbi:hypothetical protein PHMEG_00015410 [Phytophthora megakarya]|uniref:Reverse transcriptase RNase H-like domain-containing protein n=1 Tax=Phytophthora megakarya TaxID=4795 RepID=A0A225W1G3_9STRA|nr:hypothetical protein PHMEG_00015410 [Phytophthora megakarya]
MLCCSDSDIGIYRSVSRKASSADKLYLPIDSECVQSFFGCLNYYNKFIEDLPVVAAVFSKLDEDRIRAGHNLDRAKEAFEILKRKITSIPDSAAASSRSYQAVCHHPTCNPWAACGVLGQKHEGIIQPVRFTGRVLNESALRYHIAEKEMLAILRVLEQFLPLIYRSEIPIVIYTWYSVLKWLLKSKFADDRHLKWGLELSKWTLELRRVQRDDMD